MASPKPRVVVAGHLCLDITPTLAPLDGGSLASLVTPGKLVHVGAADVHTGGCVANTGLALHKLGVPVRLIGKTGCDAFAGLIRTQLEAAGAQASLQADSACSTSYTVVLAPPGIDRVFLHNPGANESFSEADVPDDLLAGAALMHFGYPPLMLRLCRDGGAELLRLFERARALGLATSLDMVAVDPASEAAAVDWGALLPRLMPLTDFFLPSAEELCFLLDRPLHAQWLARAQGRQAAEFEKGHFQVLAVGPGRFDQVGRHRLERGLVVQFVDDLAAGAAEDAGDHAAGARHPEGAHRGGALDAVGRAGQGDRHRSAAGAFLQAAEQGLDHGVVADIGEIAPGAADQVGFRRSRKRLAGAKRQADLAVCVDFEKQVRAGECEAEQALRGERQGAGLRTGRPYP